jgi:peptidoglycan/xylan/chitin deacetylase (PgdA/CDA1 family)
MTFIYKIPFFIPYFFPFFVWKIKSKKIYLTFDDGPIPEITPWILDLLKKHHVKATFFCVGDNISKHHDIFSRIIQEGHSIGNHTFNHINGWKNSTKYYLENVMQCEQEINTYYSNNLKIFRPPYGKIKPLQAYQLIKKGYKIVLWDVLSGDYNQNISPEQCFQNVIKNISPGSIIVFHDNLKAIENIKYLLPKTLEFLSENNFVCKNL